MSGAAPKTLDHVKAADTSRRPFPMVSIHPDDHCRPMVSFHYARGDDAKHARVPAFSAQHQRVWIAVADQRVCLVNCVYQYGRFDGAAFRIMRLEVLGDL